MKTEIKYSKLDYILVRTDTDIMESDTSLYAFDSLKCAKKYAISDIKDTMRNIGVIYSKECDNAVSYSKYCGNDYWCYENGDTCISWEIRKIHHRVTSKYNNPNDIVKWVKI